MKNKLIFGGAVISAFILGHKMGQKIQTVMYRERLNDAMPIFANSFAEIVTKARDEDISDDEIVTLLNETIDFLKIVKP
jgi:hypothetical protein